MNRRLSINMIANIIAFAINMGINFFLSSYLINTMGSEVYGFYPMANQFVGYAQIVLTALNSMAGRFISVQVNSGNDEQAQVYFNSVLVANTIIAVILIILSVITALSINKIINVPDAIVRDVKFLFLLVFLNLCIAIVGSCFGVATFVKNRLDIQSVINIISYLLKAVILVILYCLFRPSVAYMGIATIIVGIFTVISNMFVTRKIMPEIHISRKYAKISAVKQLISSGIWNSINQLSLTLLNGLDLVISNLFLGAAAMGEISVANILPGVIASFLGVLVAQFSPQFTIYYAQKKRNELITSVNNSIKILSIIMSVIIAFIVSYGYEFYSLWTPNEDITKIYQLSLLCAMTLFVSGCVNSLYQTFTVTNRLKIPSIVLLCTGITSTLLVLLLVNITNLGQYAVCGVSAVLGVIRNLLFTPIFAAICLKEKKTIFYKDIFRGMLCTGVAVVIGFFVKYIIPADSWLTIILSAGTASVVSLVLNLFVVTTKQERSILINKISELRKG